MDINEAKSVLEAARREQSCDLADGLIDDLVPYWEVLETALGNIIADGRCREALAAVSADEAARSEVSDSHRGFFRALLSRYEEATGKDTAEEPGDVFPGEPAEGTLAAEQPDVADFIEHGLYEAFSVPDAYGTFDLTVFPRGCAVTGECSAPGAPVSGYVLDDGKMLLVTREDGRVRDVRYAEATEANLALVREQSEDDPFRWDAVESRDHEALRRDGAIPPQPRQ